MTKTEIAQSPVPTLRGWLGGASSLFTANAAIERGIRWHGTPVSALNTGNATTPRVPTAADIASEDWDLLFRAVLERLAAVAVEKPAPGGAGVRLQGPGDSLRACLEALDQLRTSVPLAQWVQGSPPARANGPVALHVPTGLER